MADWRDTLEVGDTIIERKSKVARLVRQVTKWRGQTHAVCLAIKHCSWTHRAYTVITRPDLGYRFRPSKYPRVKKPNPRQFERALEQGGLKPCEELVMECCDVRGWP